MRSRTRVMKIGQNVWQLAQYCHIAKDVTSSICGHTDNLRARFYRCYKDLIYILMMHLFLTCDNGSEYPGISVIGKFCCDVFCLVSEV